MTWKCPNCGIEVDDSAYSHAVEAGGCGYVKFPASISLSSEVTGKQLTLRLPTTLGQSSLKIFGDEEVRFASSEQFSLAKSLEAGGWLVKGISWATNPTFLNGAPIPAEGVVLKDGDKLTIRDRYLRLTVRIVY
jgi:hypothetical protein